ncbi:hypothetical protein GGI25_002345 [Coemansia spiralis]|uniref:Uncharacterized protein n=2 Tax=Coemansia TaxID=4863 RepID=A0A9W8G8W4_9FUNG|nr:hypothetical protein EDC05_004312 [Coemansia umbellata]KAJ2622149.1 hypothetical protein GGI26_003444 [Coemansia sp. RSA 1358]KAJ2678360.1 hypothetical protein GGI25_002345 [Coemansia spiralis]
MSNDNTFLPSMAAHVHYVPSNFEPAYNSRLVQQRQQAQAPTNAGAGFAFERKHVPKRGRSSEETETAGDMLRANELQRCTYHRTSIVPISAKRSKAVESQV